MKKLLIVNLILVSSFLCYAQKPDTAKANIQREAEAIGHGGNNELKINLLFTVIGMPEISYERLLADNMGLGASIFFGLDKETEYKFGLIPHYRIYFGAKKASGFFIEGNASLVTVEDFYYNTEFLAASSFPSGGLYYDSRVERNRTFFGLGAAAGAKFLTRNGFLGEAYLGGGRLFGQGSNPDVDGYPRIGVTIGKRF